MTKRISRLRSLLTSSSAAWSLACFGSCAAERTPAFLQHTAGRRQCAVVQGSPPSFLSETSFSTTRMFVSTSGLTGTVALEQDEDDWNDLLPYEQWSHNSAKIFVNPSFHKSTFAERLDETVVALKDLGKSSVWVEVPMSQASLIEEMVALGFTFHHAHGHTANLNLWLREDSNKVPEFATHHVGVGAVVINSRDEILCVRGLGQNILPWKVPGGLSDLGEQISEAAEREVLEETGIRTKFHSILSFRHAHGMANGRSDLFFVCRLDPIEEFDANGNVIIPTPVPQECEISAAEWVPLSQYKDMVNGVTTERGHPMMKHVMELYEQGIRIKKKNIHSVIPGRTPSPMYHPHAPDKEKNGD